MRELPLLISLPLLAATPFTLIASAQAEDYLSIAQAQQLMFPNAKIFLESAINLSNEQLKSIKKIAGVRQRNQVQQAWRAERDGELLGWFLVDEVIGKHEFITYGAAISTAGKVLGIEILSYRETHGGQIRNIKWREHFVDKTLSDKFKLNQDIPNISGATLSCRNVTDGVKRLLAIHQIALLSALPK
jgi:Na+-translocating ferredoxin:NAD+ oxidoreductase RnfG subunit